MKKTRVADMTEVELAEYRKNAREYARAWRARNPEKAREISRNASRIRRAKHHEREREYARKYNRTRYAQSPEKYLNYEHARYRANLDTGREQARAKSAKRRARLLDSCSPGVTAEQWREILEYFNHTCAYCLRSGLPLEREHVVPITRGGRDEPNNVVPACTSCNCSKHASLLAVWYARQLNEARL